MWIRVALLLISTTALSAKAQSVSEQYLLAAANQERAAHGLTALRLDERLTFAARQHAGEMAEHRQISHRFGSEAELAERANATGLRFSVVTENVAEASNAAKIHELWMLSAGHRANLLDPRINLVGIAVVQHGGQLYAVQDFARSVDPLTVSQQEDVVEGLLAKRGLHVLEDGGDARSTCELRTGYAGSRQPWFVMRYTSAVLEELPEELIARIASGRYHTAAVGACALKTTPWSGYSLAVKLYP